MVQPNPSARDGLRTMSVKITEETYRGMKAYLAATGRTFQTWCETLIQKDTEEFGVDFDQIRELIAQEEVEVRRAA